MAEEGNPPGDSGNDNQDSTGKVQTTLPIRVVQREGLSEDEVKSRIEKATKSISEQLDKTTKSQAELVTKLRNADIRAAAASRGVKYPELLIPQVPADVEDVDAAVEELIKKYPALTHPGPGDGGAGGGGSKREQVDKDDMNAQIRQQSGYN